MGYHRNNITKGILGASSKIQEEFEEFMDAVDQGAHIMALMELSDLYGAIEAYVEVNFPTTTMEDIKKMSDLTKEAFRDGTRKNKDLQQ